MYIASLESNQFSIFTTQIFVFAQSRICFSDNIFKRLKTFLSATTNTHTTDFYRIAVSYCI